MGKSWTAEEDRKLSFDWGVFRIDTLAKRMGRTPAAIKIRAYKLQLGPPSRGTETVNELVTKTGYSKPQILNAARTLGITIHRRASSHLKKGRYRFTAIEPDEAEKIIKFLTDKPDGARIRFQHVGVWGEPGRGGRMKPDRCVGCDRSDRPHYAKDRCECCYQKWRYESRKVNWQDAGPGC